MTTVNDIADIVRIMREQPEWADTIRSVLLSRELLELPQRFAEYAEATNRRLERLETVLADFMDSTNRRLESLEIGQTALRDGQAKLEAGQASHAVVASYIVDPDVEPIFASGSVYWHEFPRRYLESD